MRMLPPELASDTKKQHSGGVPAMLQSSGGLGCGYPDRFGMGYR